MGKIKYGYSLNENNELVHISSVSAEDRHRHTYHCLECGHPLVARIGQTNTPHFAHDADTACDGESYLHKLAKRRILNKFICEDSFPLTFTRDVPCCDSGQCPCYSEGSCFNQDVSIPSDLKTWKGNVVYDTCQEEVRVGEFQPDLLLTCSTKPNREPVFIEVYKTHPSEEAKVTSAYRIIETMKIKTEADIDNIINRGFVEGQNCRLFNFNPKLPSIKKNDIPITRFILYENGAANVLSSINYIITCDKVNQRVDRCSVRELNLMKTRIDIWGNNDDNTLDSYQKGLVYLVKKGMDIKNCILCRFYKYNEWQNTHVCTRYKSLGEKFHFPKQTTARDCPLYEIDRRFLNHSLSELEKEVSEVPM